MKPKNRDRILAAALAPLFVLVSLFAVCACGAPPRGGAPDSERTAASGGTKEPTKAGDAGTKSQTPTQDGRASFDPDADGTASTDAPTPTTAGDETRAKIGAAECAAALINAAKDLLLPVADRSCPPEDFVERYGASAQTLAHGEACRPVNPYGYGDDYHTEGEVFEFDASFLTDYGLRVGIARISFDRASGLPLPALFDFSVFPEVDDLPYDDGAGTTLTEADRNGGRILLCSFTAPEENGYFYSSSCSVTETDQGAIDRIYLTVQRKEARPSVDAAAFAGTCKAFALGCVREMTTEDAAIDAFLAGCLDLYAGKMKEEKTASGRRYFLDGTDAALTVEKEETSGKDGKTSSRSLRLSTDGGPVPPLPEALDFYAFPMVDGLPFEDDDCVLRADGDGVLLFSFTKVDEKTGKTYAVEMRFECPDRLRLVTVTAALR